MTLFHFVIVGCVSVFVTAYLIFLLVVKNNITDVISKLETTFYDLFYEL